MTEADRDTMTSEGQDGQTPASGSGTNDTGAGVSARRPPGASLGATLAHSTTGVEREQMLDRAALVACHPDDEILWFGSVIGGIPRVMVAFLHNRLPTITQGRVRCLAAHPKPGLVSLGLTEAGVFGLGGRSPKPTAYGIEITAPGLSALYQSNYDRLVELLRPVLKDRRNVFTHNPWGEYGHPEHIQTHCAVRNLQQEFGFRLWFPNYVSKRARTLRNGLASSIHVVERTLLPTDLELVRKIQQVYVQNHCWTWYLSYRWPRAEEFLAQEPDATGSTLVCQYAPISLNQRLAPADRLRWMRAANLRAVEASPAGRFLSGLAVRIRKASAQP